jgi:hypothetical protein
MEVTSVEGISASTIQTSRDLQLGALVALARRIVRLIDAFDQRTLDALDAEGWHCGQAFALRAELTRAVECAGRATHRRADW